MNEYCLREQHELKAVGGAVLCKHCSLTLLFRPFGDTLHGNVLIQYVDVNGDDVLKAVHI